MSKAITIKTVSGVQEGAGRAMNLCHFAITFAH